jgi:hypothetical protein
MGKKFRVGKSVYKIYNGLGVGSGPSRFEKPDSDPDKNRPDPQHQ